MPVSMDTNFLAYQERQTRDSRAEFSLTTQDGDVVTLRASSAEQADVSVTGLDGTAVQLYDFSASRALSQDVSLVVEGALDAGELEAFADLYAQVESLAARFFDGDMTAALEQALDLEVDFNEIASFSLNLSQTETRYREAVSVLPTESSAAASPYRPLADAAGAFAGVFEASREWLQRLTGEGEGNASRPAPPTPASLVDQLLTPLLEEAEPGNRQFAQALLERLSG